MYSIEWIDVAGLGPSGRGGGSRRWLATTTTAYTRMQRPSPPPVAGAERKIHQDGLNTPSGSGDSGDAAVARTNDEASISRLWVPCHLCLLLLLLRCCCGYTLLLPFFLQLFRPGCDSLLILGARMRPYWYLCLRCRCHLRSYPQIGRTVGIPP